VLTKKKFFFEFLDEGNKFHMDFVHYIQLEQGDILQKVPVMMKKKKN